MIKEKINSIKNSIPNNVKLIAVSKTKSVEDILEAYNAGQRDFGENKVQELINKIDKLPKDINWHMIGHLQTNKVKDCIRNEIVLIHSVDSIKLAKEIDKESKKKNKITNILIEINIGNEDSKFGISPSELEDFLEQIIELSNINVEGLMCVAPNTNDTSKYFRQMKELARKYNLKELSMGMTNDYKEAINEGSTMIRLGTLIFGERNYMKEKIDKIMTIMEEIDYGFKDDQNNNLVEDDDKWNDFSKFYYLLSPEELLKTKCGVCWDQVELERNLFEKNNIDCKTYFIYIDDNKNLPSHTFLTYSVDNIFYWFEHSWYNYKGIHKYNNEKDMLEDIKNKFIDSRKDEVDENYKLYLYEYKKPNYHISCNEFYEYIKTQKRII